MERPDTPVPGNGTGGERVLLGLDRILLDPELFWKIAGSHPGSLPSHPRYRVGLVTSDAAPPGLPSQAASTARARLLAAGVPITRLLTPEHGLSASVQDGGSVPDGRDAVTGLPVTSLYGPRLAPPPELLEEVDLLLFDLQDVGARFYTFLWTLSQVMESCAARGVPLRVLDRPNPLGGLPEWVEGPLPDPGSAPTFLARWPIPVRHSLTLGEMALLLRHEMELELDLAVVAMRGWRREALWPATGLPFAAPSPGIPSFRSALLYPGLAFLEATNVREGRGTELAFQWLGAPWMDPEIGASALNEEGYPGVRARPLELVLKDGPCPGVILQITDPGSVRPVALGLRLLSLLGRFWPEKFRWTPYPTVANPDGHDHLLRLTGCSEAVKTLEESPERLSAPTANRLTRAPGWWERAKPHLIYT